MRSWKPCFFLIHQWPRKPNHSLQLRAGTASKHINTRFLKKKQALWMICEYSSSVNHQMSPIKTTTTNRQKTMKTRIYTGFMRVTQGHPNMTDHFLLTSPLLAAMFLPWKLVSHRVTQTNKRTKGRKPPAPQGGLLSHELVGGCWDLHHPRKCWTKTSHRNGLKMAMNKLDRTWRAIPCSY